MSHDAFDWPSIPQPVANLIDRLDAWLDGWNTDAVALALYWGILTALASLALVGCALILWGMDWLTKMAVAH